MLVIVGANGRTGVELLRLAEARGLTVRPVVRDDRDIQHIKGLADVQKLAYADPMVPQALDAVMEGASRVISCIDARTGGPGSIVYEGLAAENVVNAARRAGAERILHVSVMGAYRWSYHGLNRRAFYLEGGVRNCDAPWAIGRISCYHDEILEGHVRPPDGGRPHTFKPASRYSPISRREAARALMDYLDCMTPGRAQALGGPKVYTGAQLEALVGPMRQGSQRRRTKYVRLPPGDVSVAPPTTESALGWVPQRTLEEALADDDAEGGPPPTVYPQGDPRPHPFDRGGGLTKADPDLRFVVHKQLSEDLARIGVTDAVSLDFGPARPGRRWVRVHGGEVSDLSGVRVLDAQGQEIHRGDIDLLRDALADEFRCWWKGEERIPASILRGLDMGVKRRLSRDPHFA